MVKIWTREEYDKLTNGKIFWKIECPFCDFTWKQDQVIWKWEYWKIIYNIFPLSGDKKHIMAIPNAHKSQHKELSNEEFSELRDVYQQVEKFYWDLEYFSFTRETMGNRSVEHLHKHFLPWKMQGEYIIEMLKKQK